MRITSEEMTKRAHDASAKMRRHESPVLRQAARAILFCEGEEITLAGCYQFQSAKFSQTIKHLSFNAFVHVGSGHLLLTSYWGGLDATDGIRSRAKRS
jgi:hypothetical protein